MRLYPHPQEGDEVFDTHAPRWAPSMLGNPAADAQQLASTPPQPTAMMPPTMMMQSPGMMLQQPGMMPLMQSMQPMMQPWMMQPGMMQPGMMQPGMLQPGMLQPGMLQPGMLQPGMMLQQPPGTMMPPLLHPSMAANAGYAAAIDAAYAAPQPVTQSSQPPHTAAQRPWQPPVLPVVAAPPALSSSATLAAGGGALAAASAALAAAAVPDTAVPSLAAEGSATERSAEFTGAAPPEAGDIEQAAMWWYRDSGGADHGPYPVEQMRSWLAAGYFDGATKVAASYFGEVPEQTWPVSQLWANPAAQAWRPTVTVMAAPTVTAPEYLEEYVASDGFAGARANYVYKIGHYGVGYYKDEPPKVEVTAESLLEEKFELSRKRKANNTFGVGKFDVWSD